MKSNTEQCQVMCMRENNPNYGCSVMGSKLGTITGEKIFEQLSEITAHYSVVVKKVNTMSGVIRKQRDSKTENTIMPRYGCTQTLDIVSVLSHYPKSICQSWQMMR